MATGFRSIGKNGSFQRETDVGKLSQYADRSQCEYGAF